MKRDSSHAGIKAALIAAGRPLFDTSHLAGLGCDFITEHIWGHVVFLEAKPEGPPSICKLTKSEEALKALFPRRFMVVQTPEQALEAVGIAVERRANG